MLNANPSAFQVTPSQSTLPVGTNELFSAQLLLDSGDIIDITSQVTWSTSNAQVLSVSNAPDSKGHAVGVAPGAAQVIANIQFAGNMLVDTADVTVVAPALQRVVVTPASAQVPVGARGALHATAFYADNSTRDVTREAIWQSSQPNVLTVVSGGDQAGNGLALAEGTAIVSALFGGARGQSTIAVTPATLVSLQITPQNTTISAGLGIQYYATGLYSDGVSRDLTREVSWLTGNSAVAVIDLQGYARSVAAGATTISAQFDGRQADANLTITQAVLTRIDVEPAGVVLAAGNSQPFTATGIYSDNTSQNLTTVAFWQSGSEAVAGITRIGVATGKAQGSAQISASFGGVTGSTLLVVTAATLNQLIVIPDNISLTTGSVRQYSAVGIYSDHIEDLTEQVTWSTSNEQLADVSNVPGDKGVVTALVPGNVSVTAQFGNLSDNTPLTIEAPATVALLVICNDTNVPAGYTTQCEAIAEYSDGNSRDVTDESQWQSSATAVASVENVAPNNAAGLVRGISTGSASISARFNQISDAQIVTITAPLLQTISVTSHNTQIVEGDTEQFTATGHFSDTTSSDLTATAFWQSAADSVLSVSNSPASKGLAAGLTAGITTISAQQDGVTGTSASITVIEQPASEIRKIEILCLSGEYSGPVEIAVGETDECKAYASRKDGTVDDVTALATWTVDKPDVLGIIGLTPAQDYLQVRGESRGNTALRVEYDKKAVMQYKVK
ncbi:MAG TPA: Ig-like domain-containing protein [Dongiaceae bacterium]|nr:Ig-like domain-containing protein [Dongiaceae bacterium]